MNKINLKKIVAEALVACTLSFTALGLGAGTANAYPSSPDSIPLTSWQQDGHGHGHGHWGGCWWWWCWW